VSTRTKEWNSGMKGVAVVMIVPAAALLGLGMAVLYLVGMLAGVVLSFAGGFLRGVANVIKGNTTRAPGEPPAIVTGPGGGYTKTWPPIRRHAGRNA
jgi:hypothetical protein